MSADGFTREVRFQKGYDYRDIPNDGRGAHGMEIRFILRGALGAIVGVINTGWMTAPLLGGYMPSTGPQRRASTFGVDHGLRDLYPSAGSVSSHAPEQRVEWWAGPADCDVLPGGKCYGDAGFLVGDEFLGTLISAGEEAAWQFLASLYDEWLTRAGVSS